MINIENLVSSVCKGEEIYIHKTGVGEVRENVFMLRIWKRFH